MASSIEADRAQRLRDNAKDAEREQARLARLLKRQQLRRRRLTKAIADTRRRLVRAAELAAEARRAWLAVAPAGCALLSPSKRRGRGASALALLLLFLLSGCVPMMDACNRAWSAPGSYASTTYYTPTQHLHPPCRHR